MAINDKDGDTSDGQKSTLAEQIAELRRQTEALQQRIDVLEREAEDKDMARYRRLILRIEALESAVTGKSAEPAADGDLENILADISSDALPEEETSGSPPPRDGQSRAAPEEKPSLGRRIAILAGHTAFYLALVMLIVGAVLLRSAQSGAPVSVAGYCGMVVLSGSMQDVIPKDSFIITHQVDASSLQVGDDITFMASADTCVTHRIIEINRQSDGTLSFRTKGTNNQSPDSDPVPAANVVGKVVYHSLRLGQAAQWIRKNWPLLIFLVAVWAVLSWFLTRSLKSDGSEEPGKHEPKESTSAKSSAHSAKKHKTSTKIRKKEIQSNVNSDKEEAQPQDDGNHCRGRGAGNHFFRHLSVAEHQPDGEERGQDHD